MYALHWRFGRCGLGLVDLWIVGGGVKGAAGEYDFTRQVGHLLRRAYQAHTAVFHQMSADPLLTHAQFAVLCALRDHGAGSLTQVGQIVVMDPATTRGIVERLNERGLVSFARDTADRRRIVVRLEPEGRRLVKRMIPCAVRISDATVAGLNAAEQVALTYLLEKLSSGAAPPPDDGR